MTARATPLILNVNDSASNRHYVSRVLRSAGWEVVEAMTGGEGLDLAHRHLPDLVVLDIKLPDMSGLEVCRTLKNDPAMANVLVIQTSATFVTSEGKARGLESGADQYLTQPFESIELVAMVRGLLRLHEKEVEAREKADALTEADKRKDEFLAMLSHELRNPLAAIMNATTLLEALPLQPDAAQLSNTIGRQTRHLARLVDDLVDVARITRGKVVLRKERVDLAALLRHFLDVATPLAKAHDLVVSFPDEPLWVDGDVTRLEQIFSNLLGNAVKYSPVGERILLSLESTTKDGRPTARLVVRDDGVGIAPENIGAVFDLFFQADPTLARSQSGLGIGLTMVKRLVELHGGEVIASSAGTGRGSAFTLELPAVEGKASLVPRAGAGESKAPMKDGKGLSVLLVDDNEDSCEFVALFFEGEGHRVVVANDGEEGLARASDGNFDVAIVDIGLPKLDGYEVARRIRAARPDNPPVLVAVTGYGRSEDRQRALDAGFDAHLVKPVDARELHKQAVALVRERDRIA